MISKIQKLILLSLLFTFSNSFNMEKHGMERDCNKIFGKISTECLQSWNTESLLESLKSFFLGGSIQLCESAIIGKLNEKDSFYLLIKVLEGAMIGIYASRKGHTLRPGDHVIYNPLMNRLLLAIYGMIMIELIMKLQ